MLFFRLSRFPKQRKTGRLVCDKLAISAGPERSAPAKIKNALKQASLAARIRARDQINVGMGFQANIRKTAKALGIKAQ